MRQLLLPVFTLLVLLLLAACASDPSPVSRAIAWQCSDRLQFDAVADDLSARLDIPGRALELPRTASDSGARYADDGREFWIKGQEATLRLDGEDYRCKIDRMLEMARDAGIDFRAVGQEPGWILDLLEGAGFILQYDYGQQRVQLPWSEPDILDDGTRIYFTEKDKESMKLVIEPVPCIDSMSGQPYAFTVRVAYGDLHLEGCGREL